MQIKISLSYKQDEFINRNLWKKMGEKASGSFVQNFADNKQHSSLSHTYTHINNINKKDQHTIVSFVRFRWWLACVWQGVDQEDVQALGLGGLIPTRRQYNPTPWKTLKRVQLAHEIYCSREAVQDKTVKSKGDSKDLTIGSPGSSAFTVGVRSKTIDKRRNGKTECRKLTEN